eukprot:gene4782-5242_t
MSTFASGGRLTRLCHISHAACDALAPFVLACYDTINSETSKRKSDNSFFTIADGTVQYLLANHLFGGKKFAAVVGEEDETNVQVLHPPYQVDDLVIPEDLQPLINTARVTLDQLSTQIGEEYQDLSVFIDPIDGTREFSTGLGEQCSICIGFANHDGQPVAGIVYRPITQPPTFSMGAASEGFTEDRLDLTHPNARGFLTTNGKISPFIETLIRELGYERVPSGGAGNKMLMLLEGKGSAYIQDRGVSRWDTCAAQAALEAHGGVLAKLTTFVQSKALASYRYVKSEVNVDFEPQTAALTPYNARDKKVKVEGKKLGELEEFAPYSNLCGLLALNRDSLPNLDGIHEAIQKSKEAHGLSYD